MVQILQKDKRSTTDHEYVTIGFQIMKVEANREYRIHKKFKAVVTSDYVKARSVFYEGPLAKGRYVLLPSTFEPGMEAEFYMRVYSGENIKIRELKEDHPEPSFLCTMCCSPPQAVTAVSVKGASGLIFGKCLIFFVALEFVHTGGKVKNILCSFHFSIGYENQFFIQWIASGNSKIKYYVFIFLRDQSIVLN